MLSALKFHGGSRYFDLKSPSAPTSAGDRVPHIINDYVDTGAPAPWTVHLLFSFKLWVFFKLNAKFSFT